MQFTTPVPIQKSDFPISYDSEVFSVGSCFAENIAQKFSHFQFRNTVNPFGILFHPFAIEKFLVNALDQRQFDASDVFFLNERWHCFDAHSELSHPDRQQLLKNLNQAIALTHQKLKSASHIVVTMGTAWMYRLKSDQTIVANCHKIPQKEFVKELVRVEVIANIVRDISEMIAHVNPSARVIYTVSPVRHIKEGFVGNQRSKSQLIAGLHLALEDLKNAHYFPSYEIVMDELRDYRFYATDMIHPNQLAIDYIWERFVSAWIAENALADMGEVDALRKALAHKPFNPDSDQHRTFVSSVQNRLEKLRARLPWLDFS